MFRFCERDIIQDDEYNLTVCCKDNAEEIEPIRIDLCGMSNQDPAKGVEIAQVRSVVGFAVMCCATVSTRSLVWCVATSLGVQYSAGF